MGLENIRDLVDNYKAEYGIEAYLNLDHSPTVESCKRAIDEGYEFIHIDYSQAKHDATEEEIIAVTKEVVEYAKFTGAPSNQSHTTLVVAQMSTLKISITRKSKTSRPQKGQKHS